MLLKIIKVALKLPSRICLGLFAFLLQQVRLHVVFFGFPISPLVGELFKTIK